MLFGCIHSTFGRNSSQFGWKKARQCIVNFDRPDPSDFDGQAEWAVQM
jgi:hypothetical protein